MIVVTAARPAARGHAPTVAMLRARKRQILQVAAAHGASNVRVFGSVARGTSTVASDVDLLVDFEAGRTLLDQARLRRDLQQGLYKAELIRHRGPWRTAAAVEAATARWISCSIPSGSTSRWATSLRRSTNTGSSERPDLPHAVQYVVAILRLTVPCERRSHRR